MAGKSRAFSWPLAGLLIAPAGMIACGFVGFRVDGSHASPHGAGAAAFLLRRLCFSNRDGGIGLASSSSELLAELNASMRMRSTEEVLMR